MISKPSGTSSGEKPSRSGNTGSGEPEDESRDELSDMGFVSHTNSFRKLSSEDNGLHGRTLSQRSLAGRIVDQNKASTNLTVTIDEDENESKEQHSSNIEEE